MCVANGLQVEKLLHLLRVGSSLANIIFLSIFTKLIIWLNRGLQNQSSDWFLVNPAVGVSRNKTTIE